MKMKTERERDVESYLVKAIKAKGGLCYKWVSPGIRGVPDRLVILKGKVAFVEVKRANGHTRKNQDYQIERLREHDQHVFVVYAKADIDDAIEWMVSDRPW